MGVDVPGRRLCNAAFCMSSYAWTSVPPGVRIVCSPQRDAVLIGDWHSVCRHEDLEDMQRTVLAFGAIYDQEGFELTDDEIQQEFKACFDFTVPAHLPL